MVEELLKVCTLMDWKPTVELSSQSFGVTVFVNVNMLNGNPATADVSYLAANWCPEQCFCFVYYLGRSRSKSAQ